MIMIKKIASRLIFFILCFLNLNAAQLSPSIPISNPQNLTTSITRKISKSLTKKGPQILLALIYLCCLAPDQVQQTVREQLKPQNLLKNFAKEFMCYLLTTIGHELSHALVAKYLAQSPIEINLGGNANDPTIFNHKYFKIKGLDPKSGSCILTLPKNFSEEEKLKYTAIYMSGGFGGALTAILLNLFINLIETNPNFSQTVLNPLVFEQLTNALIPITKSSDASKVWKDCLNISNETIQTTIQLQSLLYELSELYLTHRANPAAANVDKIFVALLNSNTKGFFRFHI